MSVKVSPDGGSIYIAGVAKKIINELEMQKQFILKIDDSNPP